MSGDGQDDAAVMRLNEARREERRKQAGEILDYLVGEGIMTAPTYTSPKSARVIAENVQRYSDLMRGLASR